MKKYPAVDEAVAYRIAKLDERLHEMESKMDDSSKDEIFAAIQKEREKKGIFEKKRPLIK